MPGRAVHSPTSERELLTISSYHSGSLPEPRIAAIWLMAWSEKNFETCESPLQVSLEKRADAIAGHVLEGELAEGVVTAGKNDEFMIHAGAADLVEHLA